MDNKVKTEEKELLKKSQEIKASISDDDDEDDSEKKYRSNRKGDSKSKTPVLDSFSRDLTKMA